MSEGLAGQKRPVATASHRAASGDHLLQVRYGQGRSSKRFPETFPAKPLLCVAQRAIALDTHSNHLCEEVGAVTASVTMGKLRLGWGGAPRATEQGSHPPETGVPAEHRGASGRAPSSPGFTGRGRP